MTHSPRGRVCMVVHHRYPLDPRVRRATRMAREAGYAVDVVCLREAGESAREVVDGVTVWRLPLRHRRGIGPIPLALEYVAFLLMALIAVGWRGGRSGFDVVHVHTPPDFLVLAALVPRLRGARVVLDIHDISPLMFGARFSRGGAMLTRALTAVERAAARFADRVVTVHEPYRLELAKHGIAADRIEVVMNTPDERVIEGARDRARSRPGASERGWSLMYHGTITEWYGVPLLMEAVALARESIPGLRVSVIGDGDDLPRARDVAAQAGIDGLVTFSGSYLPLEEVLDRAVGADCGVVPNLASPLNDLTLSSKLLEYVALGVPVVVSRLDTLAHHFDEDEVTFFTPGDAADLARALQWVAEHPDEARAKAERALRRSAAYAWSANRDRYVALLGSLTG